MNVAPIYGLVLAGGASSRMQRDKAGLLYQNQPQLQRACELLQAHFAKIFVSIRADQQHDELRNQWPQIIDQHTDLGPLAGIVAAQRQHPEAAWLVIACDLPLLNQRTLERLLEQRDPTRPATAYRNPHKQQPEPLCAIWEPVSAELIQNAIAAGEFSPRALLSSWHTLLITLNEPDALNNVNTPDEHQQANAALPPC